MKSETDKLKWYNIILYILLFIIMLPWIIVIFIKDRIAQKKKRKAVLKEAKSFSHSTPQLIPYLEPLSPLSNEEFISRIDEFVCIQYKSFNELSGGSYAYQLIAEDNPVQKERMLSFLKEHPIEDLLYGDIISDGCDMNHWEILFVFADRNLNRRICGYGRTEISAPFLSGFVPMLHNNKF